MSFTLDLKNISKKFDGTIDDLIDGVELSLYSAVIISTPVDTGRLRGNWFMSQGSSSNKTSNVNDVSGSEAISRVQSLVGALKGGRVTFLTNNLPYAEAIEFGHSKQAPTGMVRKNVARFQRIVNTQALKVR